MISVIVPVYNVEKYIRNCLDSIINQTYKDLEIILVDDGSTDNSGAICDEYAQKDSRIKVIHKQNGGQSSARNVGLKNATGEFIGFVDSDDTIELNAYEKLVFAIDGVDLAICGHSVVNDNGTTTNSKGKEKVLDYDDLWKEIFGRLNNAVWNKLFCKELLDGIEFNQNFAHGEDLIFNILYLQKAKSGRFIDMPLYNYYKRGGAISTGKFTRRKLLEIDSKEEALRLVKEIYPPMINTAQKYCFRARMNIIRNIYKVKEQKNYASEIKEYKKYVLENYVRIKSLITKKERVEFFIFKNFPYLYKIMVKLYK